MIAQKTTQNTFESFSPSSKVWVYQAESQLTTEQVAYAKQQLVSFTSNWQAHGIPLQSAFQIIKNHFIVLSVNAAADNATGCSIDASVKVIKHLEQAFSMSLTNRLQVATENNGIIEVYNMHDLINQLKAKNIPQETLIYNNSVSTLADYNNNWKQLIYDSWLTNMA